MIQLQVVHKDQDDFQLYYHREQASLAYFCGGIGSQGACRCGRMERRVEGEADKEI
jgi:hypothetical protein